MDGYAFYGTLLDPARLFAVTGRTAVSSVQGFLRGRLYVVHDPDAPDGVTRYPLLDLCDDGLLVPAQWNSFRLSPQESADFLNTLCSYEGPHFRLAQVSFLTVEGALLPARAFVAEDAAGLCARGLAQPMVTAGCAF